MRCAESLRVQAFFDGEVDAVSAADIERHVEHCEECRTLLQDLGMVRTALHRDLAYAQAPAALRAQVARLLDHEEVQPKNTLPMQRSAPRPRNRSFWSGAFAGMSGTAIAAMLALFLLTPRLGNPLLDELVNAHLRSLMPTHLIDVVSTDKHTVKPWFAGHADVSPVVADFGDQGYRLIGGRVDYLEHQRSAVVVYQHGAHVINVFSWAGGGPLPDNLTRSGYHLAFWKAGDLTYCAISDTGWDELLGLVRLLRE